MIECGLPLGESEDVPHVICPLTSVKLVQPLIGVTPSVKLTVPPGVPEPGASALTVAVKVRACP